MRALNSELQDLVVGEETIYSALIFIMASFLFTSFIITYITLIFPSILTNGVLIIVGLILFICGGILLKKFKD